MRALRLRRAAAVALCLAIPGTFYAFGDAVDAFPGVLTLEKEEQGPTAGPPAEAESWERTAVPAPLGKIAESHAAPDQDLQDRLDSHADLPVVDGNLAYAVVDAETGETLAARDADTARTPASTLKLLTAAAALRTLDAEATLTTRAVVTGSRVTLVGEGDMLLTEKKIEDLAEQTAALLDEEDRTRIRLRLDDTALPGGENEAWGDNGRANGWVAPTAALGIDGGRLDGTQYGPKSEDPAMDAAEAFAEALDEQDIEVVGEIKRAALREDGPSARLDSEPIGDIVRHTLEASDNTTAELLGHLVARAEGRDATPKEAAAAVTEEARRIAAEIGLGQEDIDGLRIEDCSGLSRDNRVPPELLAAVISSVVSGEAPVLEQILYDVPIAGYTGTLIERFEDDDTRAARGLVRGKTGYLAGTASLAGVAVLPDGRTVGYAILVHDFEGAAALEARAAVDEIAAELVREP